MKTCREKMSMCLRKWRDVTLVLGGAPRNCLLRASSTTIAGTSNNIALVKWQHSSKSRLTCMW